MLATASLTSEEDLAVMRAMGGNLVGNMDATTECLSLSTASFDEEPAPSQESIKKAMEIHLQRFGCLYLAALHLGFYSGNASKMCAAFEDSMKLFELRIAEMAIGR